MIVSEGNLQHMLLKVTSNSVKKISYEYAPLLCAPCNFIKNLENMHLICNISTPKLNTVYIGHHKTELFFFTSFIIYEPVQPVPSDLTS